MTYDQYTPETEPPAGPAAVDTAGSEAASATTDGGSTPQYGVGPFTIREVSIVGVWVVAFVVSFFPVTTASLGAALGGGHSVWLSNLDWVLTIGVPTVAVFLIVLRRLSPTGIRRVGSLGIDQFASVAFSVAAFVWLNALWQTVAVAITYGEWIRSWVVWVEFFLALAGVVLTVLAPFIPPFRQDFEGRSETPAHRNARPVRAVTARPPRPKPQPVVPAADPTAVDPNAYQGGVYGAPVAYQGEQAAYQPEPAPYHADPAYQPQQGGYQPEQTAYQPEQSAYQPEQTAYQPEQAAYQPEQADTARAADVDASAEPVDDTAAAYGALGFDTSADDEAPGPHYARTGSLAVEPDETATADAVPAAEPAAETQAAPVHQAFWALAPTEREVHDERGMPIFTIGPTAWALVIEDRGSLFVIRHEDGRIGYLHDVTGVTRG